MTEWKQGGMSGNVWAQFDDFVVSYMPENADVLGPFFSANGGSDETALIAAGKYYILNGDYRADYERLAPEGLDACMSFYRDHSDVRSTWSTDEAAA